MLADLDWKTQFEGAIWREHWRFLVGIAVAAVPGFLILHILFPNTFWFMKLWAGLVLGQPFGALACLKWQLRDPDRRKKTSGKLIVMLVAGGVVLSGIPLFVIVPNLYSQEAKLASVRSLSTEDISKLSITMRDGTKHDVRDAPAIAQFVDSAQRAVLFYPSHEGSISDFQLTIRFAGGNSASYDAWVPERHRTDVSVSFQGYYGMGDILLPGVQKWLEAIENAEN